MKKSEIVKAIIELDNEGAFIMENLDERLLAVEKRLDDLAALIERMGAIFEEARSQSCGE